MKEYIFNMNVLLFQLIKIKQGDLLQAQTSLAHCVSQDLKMLRGLARSFKDKWPGQIDELKEMDLKVGQVGAITDDGRFIYHLITKESCTDQPTIENLKATLVQMKEHMVANDVKEVALPKIGCGMNQLSWEKVKGIIEEVFEDTDLKITIYYVQEEEDKVWNRRTLEDF